jgi:hypothetical protein
VLIKLNAKKKALRHCKGRWVFPEDLEEAAEMLAGK